MGPGTHPGSSLRFGGDVTSGDVGEGRHAEVDSGGTAGDEVVELGEIVDRLTFDAAIIETGADSYRLAQTRARAEQARVG
ncbi:hypothetical protein QF035_000125 [Streptomyces umbrinus]|uniref:Uncharacterized protein n=1 Tax=Streptomyces umbrinus TaxID=67370 RepID=A0ABU0SG43_9ACTN|nr:hypothetical protein [Streptomyces umbrinus]